MNIKGVDKFIVKCFVKQSSFTYGNKIFSIEDLLNGDIQPETFEDFFNDGLNNNDGLNSFVGNSIILINDIKNYNSWEYKNVYTITIQKELIGVICFNPRNELIDKSLIKIEFFNPVLYKLKKLYNVFDLIMNELGLGFNNIQNIDFFVDCDLNMLLRARNYFKKKVNYLIKIRNKKTYHLRHFINTKETDLNSIQTGEGTYILKDKNIKDEGEYTKSKIIIYNKSMEIRANNNKKHYIINSWKNGGLDITKDIMRLEFRMDRKDINNYNKKHNSNLSGLDFIDENQIDTIIKNVYEDNIKIFKKLYKNKGLKNEKIELKNVKKLYEKS